MNFLFTGAAGGGSAGRGLVPPEAADCAPPRLAARAADPLGIPGATQADWLPAADRGHGALRKGEAGLPCCLVGVL